MFTYYYTCIDTLYLDLTAVQLIIVIPHFIVQLRSDYGIDFNMEMEAFFNAT